MQSVRACFALHCVSAEAVVIPAEMFLVLVFFFPQVVLHLSVVRTIGLLA